MGKSTKFNVQGEQLSKIVFKRMYFIHFYKVHLISEGLLGPASHLEYY